MDETSRRALEKLVTVAGPEAESVEWLHTFAERAAESAVLSEFARKMLEIAQAVRSAQKAVERLNQRGPALVQAVHAQGMLVPSSQLSLYDLTRLVDVHDAEGDAGVIAAIEAEYSGIFDQPTFLDDCIASWRSRPILTRRLPILAEALRAHAARLFATSIPTLMAQAEGIVVDLAEHRGRASGETVRRLLSESVADTFFGPFVVAFFRDTVHEPFEHSSRPGPFSRHAILHGGDVDYATERNSQTSIMLVDVLASYSMVSADSESTTTQSSDGGPA